MAAQIGRVLRWIAAFVGAVVVLLIAAGWWLTSSMVHSEQTNPAGALAAFGEVRTRFANVRPAFEIQSDRLVVSSQPDTASSSSAASTTYLLIWQPHEKTMSRLRLPFWVARVATEPLPLETLAGISTQGFGGLAEARRRGNELNIRLGDLQQYGRTLLLDGSTSDGKHVLMWNE